jgi:type IV secretory pathway VirB2 component (pilin)
MTPIDAVRAFADTPPRSTRWRGVLALSAAVVLMPAVSYAQAGGSPWENAVNALMTSFTGPIARGLSLVSTVQRGMRHATRH